LVISKLLEAASPNSLAESAKSDKFHLNRKSLHRVDRRKAMRISLESAVLRLKRADTPFFRMARRVCVFCFTATIPVPPLLKPVGRLFYELRFYAPVLWRRFKSLVFTTPIFCCRCESVGKHLQLGRLPSIDGHTVLYIGDDVQFSGRVAISSGRFRDHPTLRIGNRAFIGHNVSITCNREVVIEDDVLIAGDCTISDYDGHPASLEKRLSHGLPDAEDMQPVRICKGAWIGSGAFILKGVTIGAGGIVGANSVVTRNVPPYCVAAGSPARVVKHIGTPDSASLANAAAA
jgi:acetyltransferase-like isoleucine patch superfamily enzyme